MLLKPLPSSLLPKNDLKSRGGFVDGFYANPSRKACGKPGEGKVCRIGCDS